MNAKEFAIRLKELAPAKSVLLGCDYSSNEADDFIDSFACRPRGEPLGIEANGDPMLELLDKWDISHVEIGPISFHVQPKQFESHLEIGTVEGDRLMRRSDTSDYVLLDSQNLSNVMCSASSNGDSLLDGLLQVAGYFAKTAVDEIDIDDENTGAEYKSKCVASFGGSNCASFCTSVLGI